jgi:hypothetical protein
VNEDEHVVQLDRAISRMKAVMKSYFTFSLEPSFQSGFAHGVGHERKRCLAICADLATIEGIAQTIAQRIAEG